MKRVDRHWPLRSIGPYVSKVALYTTQLVKEHFLLPIDAPKIITEAAQANVP